MAEERIYLDYAAGAPLLFEAACAMQPFLETTKPFKVGYNANSLHTEGRVAFSAMEEYRASIASALCIRPFELFFTSGATESDNAMLLGVVFSHLKRGKKAPHIVTTSIEHDAIYNTAHMLQANKLATVTFVSPERSGHISPEKIEQAITQDTALVSVIAAHNETGAINDIEQIGEIAHAHGALFHTDAVQALGKLAWKWGSLPIDAASFSAHKIGGPKGIGALYVKHKTQLEPYIYGGGQESGMRSGTQNVCGMAGFAAAVEAQANMAFVLSEQARLMQLRDKLYAALCSYKRVHKVVPCEAGLATYLPNIVNIYIDNVESETSILKFDLEGIAVSGGSACSSHSLDASRSLIEIGIPHDSALCALRISMGHATTESCIEKFLKVFDKIYSTL